MRTLRPTIQPNSPSACRNAPLPAWYSESSAVPGINTPTRRTRSPCCARAASGHAATPPPSATSNSRRPMVTVIRPSRARCVKATIPRHERTVLAFEEGQNAGCFHLCRRLQLLPSPAFRESRHRGLARRLVAVRRPAVLVLAKGERSQPWLAGRCGSRLHDSADDDAIADHVEVVVVPLAGRTGGRGALEGQIVLVHFTEPTRAASLDHLVGAAEQQRGHVEADCLCGTDVDHQLEPGRLYNRQVGGLGAHENSAGVVADLEVCIAQVCTVGQESAGCGELTPIVNRRNRVACCKRNNSITSAVQERVGGYKQRTGPLF